MLVNEYEQGVYRQKKHVCVLVTRPITVTGPGKQNKTAGIEGVHWAIKIILPVLRHDHMLVHSENVMMVSYINHQDDYN